MNIIGLLKCKMMELRKQKNTLKNSLKIILVDFLNVPKKKAKRQSYTGLLLQVHLEDMQH